MNLCHHCGHRQAGRYDLCHECYHCKVVGNRLLYKGRGLLTTHFQAMKTKSEGKIGCAISSEIIESVEGIPVIEFTLTSQGKTKAIWWATPDEMDLFMSNVMESRERVREEEE